MPLKLALGVRETVAGHRLGALEGGVPPPLPMHPWGLSPCRATPPAAPQGQATQPLHDCLSAREGCGTCRAVLKGPDFFFFVRTALKDRPKGLPTANSHQPPTATNRQPPTAANRQRRPTAANRQRRPTANCQPLPPATNHQSPTTNRCQPPPTPTNRQLPTANCQLPPTANRQPPPTMVEHMECPRAFLGKLVPEHFFFSR